MLQQYEWKLNIEARIVRGFLEWNTHVWSVLSSSSVITNQLAGTYLLNKMHIYAAQLRHAIVSADVTEMGVGTYARPTAHDLLT